MATLYFNAAVDNDWNTLGNWWTDAACTAAASGLPTSSDSVILSGEVYSNSGSAPTIVNLTATNYSVGNVSMTVTGVATFTGNANPAYYSGTLTGNATFDAQQASEPYPGGASLSYDATISGNATFTNGARNYGTVTGNGTFTNNGGNGDGSSSFGTVSGNATFDATSGNRGGTVSGNATFTGTTYSASLTFWFPTFGTISGSVTFSSPTPVTFNLLNVTFLQNSSGWTFTGGTATWNFGTSSQLGMYGQSVANGDAEAVAKGNCNFEWCACFGRVIGNATFSNAIHYRGSITGSATYNNAYIFGSYDGAPDHPAGNPSVGNGAVFTGNTQIEFGAFNGDCFFDIQAAKNFIKDGESSVFQTVTILYEKGVNGSSILGIV